MFSRNSSLLKRQHATKLSALVSVLEDAYTPRLTAEVLEEPLIQRRVPKIATCKITASLIASNSLSQTTQRYHGLHNWEVDKQWLSIDEISGQVEPLVLLKLPLPVDNVQEMCPPSPSWDSKVDLAKVEAALLGNDVRFCVRGVATVELVCKGVCHRINLQGRLRCHGQGNLTHDCPQKVHWKGKATRSRTRRQ